MKKFGYESLFQRHSKAEVSSINLKESKKLEKRKNQILTGSLIGLFVVIALVVMGEQDGMKGIGIFGISTLFAYFLGYYYCLTLWDLEKNDSEYYQALRKAENDENKP